MNQFYFPLDWEEGLEANMLQKRKHRKKVYICSPLSGETAEEILSNIRNARAYMYYIGVKMNAVARAPHAYLPFLLCDDIPAERSLALQFGLRLLEESDALFVCGNRISGGMKGEIQRAAELKMPITVFDRDTYIEVRRLATQCGADKKLVAFSECHDTLAASSPVSEKERTVTKCYANFLA